MNIDKQQHVAVHTESKKALVLSGAGSGKTRVLIERIAHLTENCKVTGDELRRLYAGTRKPKVVEIRKRKR